MCEFCEKRKVMLEVETLNPNTVAFCGGVPVGAVDDLTERIVVFVDPSGYLRLVDPDDCNCLDHGEKIKIHFCPNCGEGL